MSQQVDKAADWAATGSGLVAEKFPGALLFDSPREHPLQVANSSAKAGKNLKCQINSRQNMTLQSFFYSLQHLPGISNTEDSD